MPDNAKKVDIGGWVDAFRGRYSRNDGREYDRDPYTGRLETRSDVEINNFVKDYNHWNSRDLRKLDMHTITRLNLFADYGRTDILGLVKPKIFPTPESFAAAIQEEAQERGIFTKRSPNLVSRPATEAERATPVAPRFRQGLPPKGPDGNYLRNSFSAEMGDVVIPARGELQISELSKDITLDSVSDLKSPNPNAKALEAVKSVKGMVLAA